MQADIVNNQVDFTTLQTLSPQLNSFNPNETVSVNRKSFDDMIQDVRQAKEKPVEKTEPSEKKDSSIENQKIQNSENTDKTAKSEIHTESEKVTDESEARLAKEDKTSGKIDSKLLKKQVEPENLTKQNPYKTENKEDSEKKIEYSFNDLEKLLENAREVSSENDEKKVLTFEDMKNLVEGNQEELAAAVNVVEQTLGLQNDISFEDMTQISENVFESSENVENVKTKTFSLDKDGKVIVKDLRSEKIENESKENSAKAELKVTDVKYDGKNNAEMTLEVAANVQQNITSSNDQSASAVGSNFQAMLTNQIQQNAGEIVKAGNIILKDNDVGSIKLILKPEQLGNVKIDLQINDKNITGRIVVATQEAYNAFKESAENLKQAFINSGFESAGLDLSFAGQNNNGNQMANQENPAKHFAMARSYGDLTESDTYEDFEQEEILSNSLRNSVNIVA